jgi:hypothetical protein
VVTQLRQCGVCSLRFRVPKEDTERANKFYESEYQQGSTTEVPSPDELQELMASGFAGTERDYSRYIAVLESWGIRRGARVLDFGCSWGYGSWQLRRAGYEVFSYELSHRRAEYARIHLGCTMVEPGATPTGIDCVFAAHVLEHLCVPQEFWRIARQVLVADGSIACFVPNGNPALEAQSPDYHKLWGQVHPLLLAPASLRNMAEASGFRGSVYSTPYPLQAISRHSDAPDLFGDELALLARMTDAPMAA